MPISNETYKKLALVAVEPKDIMELSTNFIDVISDCESLDDFTLRNELQDYYPLATWLLGTRMASTMRRRSTDPQKFHKSSTEGVEWEMDVPGTVYTLEPSNEGTDCCWTMPDFAKCAGNVPLMMLCLKDCDKIFDQMIMERLRINERASLEGIANEGETVDDVNERLRIVWFAFYLAHTAIMGTTNTSDNITKPFHGLLQVVQNPAVVSISGANILAAFASIGCRLDVLGGDDWVFATNPLIYSSLKAAIVPDQYGKYPADWEVRDGELYYKGIGFIRDKILPVDLTAGTGDVLLIDGSATGLFFGFNLNDPYEIRNDFTEQTLENGCGQVCTYLYNFGAVANNNANRIMVVSGVPISSACTEIADLAGLINPNTLIPAA